MRKIIISPNEIISYFDKEKISTINQLKKTFMTSSTMTIFRRLKSLGYLTSYSHRGKYYTLMNIAAFNKQGIWSYRSVWFSAQGNLCNTVKHFVTQSEAGWSAQELGNILHVEVKRPLLQLCISKDIYREKSSGVYVYYSTLPDVQRMQLLMRREKNAEVTIGLPAQIEALSHELKAAIILFFSLLDEQQRRLYAGLEAHKMGHGGDRQISELLGMDVHTVAKGRRELFGGDVLRGGSIRKNGGGRKRTEKKRY
jgi:hypothetical protein